jgi:hypothetical protein
VRYIIRADKNDMSDIFLIAGQTGAEWWRFPFNLEQEIVKHAMTW